MWGTSWPECLSADLKLSDCVEPTWRHFFFRIFPTSVVLQLYNLERLIPLRRDFVHRSPSAALENLPVVDRAEAFPRAVLCVQMQGLGDLS